MSKSIINKLFNETYNKELRHVLQKVNGQLLFVQDTKAFDAALKSTLGSRKYLTPKNSEAILKAGQDKARQLHENFKRRNPGRYKILLDKIYRDNLLRRGEVIGLDVFIVSSFKRSIGLVRTAMMNALVKERPDVSKQVGRDIRALVHRGHGERGEAVSQVQIAQGIGALRAAGLSDRDIQDHLQSAFSNKALDIQADEAESIKTLAMNYSQIVDDGGIRADYISKITLQFAKENTGLDAQFEKKALDTFYKKLIPFLVSEKILDLEGSSTLNEKIESKLMDALTTGLPKSAVKRSKKVPLKTKGAITQTIKSKSSVKKVNTKVGTKKPRAIKETSAQTLLELRRLIPLMNKRLHDEIRERMGSPALNYRTGRFAESAKVLDITRSRRMGDPTISWTYQKDPYQVFEMGSGSSLATRDRDPRNIIGPAVRDIAKDYIMQRFYTKRV